MSPGGAQPLLYEHGLNMRAVFDIAALPPSLHDTLARALPDLHQFRQLHLFGQGGRGLWQSLQALDDEHGPEPVDDFAGAVVRRYFDEGLGAPRYRLLLPYGEATLPLQKLGELAGWHHESPFRVGVNGHWGSWFAYRAVVLADTALLPTPKADWGAVCPDCAAKPCINACPVGALATGTLDLEACVDYRLQEGAHCSRQCLARIICPVGAEHRYTKDQIRYHYGRSLITLKAWRQKTLDQPSSVK